MLDIGSFIMAFSFLQYNEKDIILKLFYQKILE